MVEVGARIVVESEKVGSPPRSGVVTGAQGELLRVRRDDGTESSFIPAAGLLKPSQRGPEVAESLKRRYSEAIRPTCPSCLFTRHFGVTQT